MSMPIVEPNNEANNVSNRPSLKAIHSYSYYSRHSVPTLSKSSTKECSSPITECIVESIEPYKEKQENSKQYKSSSSSSAASISSSSASFESCSASSTPINHDQESYFKYKSIETILLQNGYRLLDIISKTLQGELVLAEMSNHHKTKKVAIKRTNKELARNRICFDDDESGFNDESGYNATHLLCDENIISEAVILNHVTRNNKPPGNFISKFIHFFESDHDYYLVMEYVNDGVTLNKFCEKAHQFIKRNMLDTKEWKKIVKFILWQIMVVIYYLHEQLNIAHLDLNMVCHLQQICYNAVYLFLFFVYVCFCII